MDVASAFDEAHRHEAEIHDNRASRCAKVLQHHMNVSVFLAVQGLLFRGDDESKTLPNIRKFVELLDLLNSYSNDLKTSA